MKNIKGIIWDFDGVFYPYSQECLTQFRIAIAKTAVDLVPGLSVETASGLIEETYRGNGNFYTSLKQAFNLQSSQLNALYHNHFNIDFMQPNRCMNEKIKQMNVKHVMLTHGHRPWIDIASNKVEITEIFPRQNQIVFEDLNTFCDGTHAKETGEKPFEMALDILGCKPEEVVMVEDTRNNLIIPWYMGIKTVHVHPVDALKPEHVHHVFEETEQFVDYFLRQRFQPL